MKEYEICYSLDLNYLEQMSASIASVLANARDDENIKFYILCADLNKEAQKQIETLRKIKNFDIEYIKVNNSDFSKLPMLKDRGGKYEEYHVAKPTYYRFLLSDFIKKADKVLYLDCDVIIKDSLEPLFMLDLKNAPCAAAPDAEFEKNALRLGIKQYFNAGVMLINLDYWQKNNISEKLFKYAAENKDKIIWQDQDIMNAVFSGTVKILPDIWNYQYFQYENPSSSAAAKAVILHLAGRFKPWIIPFESSIYEEYYEYLKLTPFKNKIVQYRLNSAGKRLKNETGGSVTNIAEIPARDEIKKCFNFVNEKAAAASAETDVKISKVYDEVSKNYKYTEELNEKLHNAVKNDISDLNAALLEETDNRLSNLREALSENKNYIDIKFEAVKKEFKEHSEETFLNIQDEILLNRQSADIQNKNQLENIESKFTNEINKLKSLNENEINTKIEKLNSNITVQTDDKISKVYDEISKNYKYTETIVQTSETEQNKKIEDIQASIASETNEKIEILNKNLTIETDVKIENLNNNISIQTDEKISKVYDEISKNYKYTETLVQSAEIEQSKKTEALKTSIDAETNKKIENLNKDISVQTEDKISKVYEEVSKNYKYTETLVQSAETERNKKIEELQNSISAETNEKIEVLNKNLTAAADARIENLSKNITAQTDVKLNTLNKDIEADTNKKISKIYEEISKNSEYTEFLIRESEEKQNKKTEEYKISAETELKEKLETLNKNLTVYTDAAIEKLNNDISFQTDEKVKNAVQTALTELDEAKRSMEKTAEIKFNEVYSVINERSSNLYKEMQALNTAAAEHLNFKIKDLYRKNDMQKDENIRLLSVIRDAEEKIKRISDEQTVKYELLINGLKTEYEEKLNYQRIAYETKLIDTENKINELNSLVQELKISPLKRFLAKLRKKISL